jgi:hypothetical protein
MAPKPQLGTPITPSGPDPIPNESIKDPGFGEKLSDDARKDIKRIEANVRSAEQRTGSFIVR